MKTLGIKSKLLQTVKELGFVTPTEIQNKVIPILLDSPRDLIAIAQTGTGKTAAFGLPLLEHLDLNNNITQSVILSPTRELCIQITNELSLYSKYIPEVRIVSVYGGANIAEQSKKVKKGAHVIVATPGRLQDMLRRRYVDLSKVEYVILDEADEMLNMGFYDDIQNILSHTPNEKFTWLFSATMPNQIREIAKKFMLQPLEISVGVKNTASDFVTHEFYLVGASERYYALKRLVDTYPNIYSVIFCRTKRMVQKIAEKLIEDGYNANALHGDLSQNQRDMVMSAFRNKQLQLLVATDVAARGIDVEELTHVIHFQLPDEIEIYTHRSGRTGRAGKKGVSMIIATKSEIKRLKTIEKNINKPMEAKELPTGEEICRVQLLSLANKVKDTQISEGIKNFLDEIHKLFEEETKEELISKFFSVEFSRFYEYYKNLSDPKKTNLESYINKPSGKRFYINIGKKDNLTWQSLKEFLSKETNIGTGKIFHVDIFNSFSFFNVENEFSEKVIPSLKDKSYQGRKINIESSERSRDNSVTKRSKNSRRSKNDYKRIRNKPKPVSNQRYKRHRRKSNS